MISMVMTTVQLKGTSTCQNAPLSVTKQKAFCVMPLVILNCGLHSVKTIPRMSLGKTAAGCSGHTIQIKAFQHKGTHKRRM